MSKSSEQEARGIHKKLTVKIEAEGIILRANIRLGSEDPQTTGYFVPDFNHTGEPKIQLYRNERADKVDDYEQELVTLAHEYGHAISYRRGERPREEMPQPSPDLPTEEKRMIQDEEARAWRYGREVLLDLGFSHFSVFDERKAEADAIYLRSLCFASND